jgi:arabinofuranosyltransferase
MSGAAPEEAAPRGGWWEGLPLLIPAGILLTTMWSYKGYIKDDSFISYRFARNLAEGNGPVFNLGERVEGYTNFLWIVLTAPAFWFDADPVRWSKIMGAGFALAAMVMVFWGARWLGGSRPSPFHYIPPLLLACSTSVALWAMSGMAPPLMLFAGTTCIVFLWRALEEERRLYFVLAGAAAVMASLTRPEGHMFVIVAGLATAVVAIRRRRIPAGGWWLVGVAAAVLVPYHAWRYAYFGELLPNTYYVKAATGPEVYKEGWQQLGNFMGFNVNWGIGIAALAALLPAVRRPQRLLALGMCVFFMLYLVKIGRDEMKHYRLFLPVFGLYVLLAGEGLRALCQLWKGWQPRWMAAVPAFAVAVALAVPSLKFTREHRYEDRYLEMSEKSFQQMGRYILEHSDEGDKAIFQDMGACPYAGYPRHFVDPIGVVDYFVAHELAAIELNPFLRGVKAAQPGGRQAIVEFDARVRDYLLEQDARFIGMVAYVSKRPKSKRSEFRKRFDAAMDSGDPDAVEAVLAPRLSRNSHHHGLYTDSRFEERYHYVRTWRRNNGYYLVLFERSAAR